MRPSPLLLLTLLACTPPGPDDSTPPEGDSDVDTDTDGDTDGDADGDTDADTDADGDADCVDYSDIVADCLELVVEVDGGGAYYSGISASSSSLDDDLHRLIDDHTSVSYDDLWEVFEYTDRRADGMVWDPYSDVPGGTPPYTFRFDDKCGQYAQEGDCYNREHTWPSSWFNDLAPMRSDLHQLYPTDGYVNSIRGSFPYGPVDVPSYTSLNGSLRGTSALCDYPWRVFEPIDGYKGDLARAQLYMSVRYRGEDSGWSSSEATDRSTLEPWYATTLLAWHLLDPVDAKEIARNDAIQDIQGNRNPFVDHPEYACYLWP
ncbi:MAG: endonuclease [Pseudomonadota bacterium]